MIALDHREHELEHVMQGAGGNEEIAVAQRMIAAVRSNREGR